MKHVTVQEARAQLEALLEAAQAGETIEIVRDGEVIAKLTPGPIEVPAASRPFDIEALREHQRKLTGPVERTEDALREWKDEARY